MDRLLFGLLIMVVGMIIVFIALVLLVYLFKIMSAVVKRIEPSEAETAPDVDWEPVFEAPAAPAVQDDEGEVAAAVAAVMMLLDNEAKSEDGITVRRLRRDGARAPKWRQYSAIR